MLRRGFLRGSDCEIAKRVSAGLRDERRLSRTMALPLLAGRGHRQRMLGIVFLNEVIGHDVFAQDPSVQ